MLLRYVGGKLWVSCGMFLPKLGRTLGKMVTQPFVAVLAGKLDYIQDMGRLHGKDTKPTHILAAPEYFFGPMDLN